MDLTLEQLLIKLRCVMEIDPITEMEVAYTIGKNIITLFWAKRQDNLRICSNHRSRTDEKVCEPFFLYFRI